MIPTKQLVKGPAALIAYASYGQDGAPLVVMTHSILPSAMMWHEQTMLLLEQGYQVLCADTRGHGESHASKPPYSMGDLDEDVVALLDGAVVRRSHFVGLSLGGMTALALASSMVSVS